MNRLERKEQQIFALESNNGVCVFGSKAQTGTFTYSLDPNEIQGDYFKDGWGKALIADFAPLQEDFSAIDYVISYNVAYVMQQGIPEWSSSTTYFKGSIACVLDTEYRPVLYYSLIDNNTGNNPLTDNEVNWRTYKSEASFDSQYEMIVF